MGLAWTAATGAVASAAASPAAAILPCSDKWKPRSRPYTTPSGFQTWACRMPTIMCPGRPCGRLLLDQSPQGSGEPHADHERADQVGPFLFAVVRFARSLVGAGGQDDREGTPRDDQGAQEADHQADL